VVGLSVLTRSSIRWLLFGLATAISLVCSLAVLSRLVPSWFPADTTANLYATSRLRYPFDYSDGVGEFAALGLPLLLYVSSGARTLAGRALAAAAVPVVVLCLAMTVSRGGILAAAVGVIIFFALVPARLPRLGTAAIVAAGSAVLIAGLLQRAGVRDAFPGPAPPGQRHSMLLLTALAAVGVGLVQAGFIVLQRNMRRPRWLVVSHRSAALISYVLVALVAAVIAFGIANGTVHHLWQEFKQPNPPRSGNTYSRLLSVAGSHRYQYWVAAVHAFKTSPWKGIGPGTFEFYWAQHNSLGEFVRNAHSLWIETLAGAGLVGLALIGGFFIVVLGAGAVRGFDAASEWRLPVATAVAGVAAFCAAAAFDWVWQIGVMPLVAMLLAAVALGPVVERHPPVAPPGHRASAGRSRVGLGRGRTWTRIALLAATLAALWAIVVPLASTIAVRSSEAAVRSGNFRAALSDASTAQRIEPAAATPRLQRALILEQLGEIRAASQSISQAEVREPTNWRIWLVASRIATELNEPKLALADYLRARSLNPTSPLFPK
jgi:O-antigen ligase/polysaccharide polymerase Wzy-like membrane protein